ncbi:MAG: hypothetical protein II028_00610 [Clostridia bacterium]|nr:hypothetical protein [Clostridia bacterium]
MSKKLIALLLAAMMVLAMLAACGNNNNTNTNDPGNNNPTTGDNTTPADPTAKKVYYTYLTSDHANLNFQDNVDSPSETPAIYCMCFLYRSYPDESGLNFHYIPDAAAELPIQIDEHTWNIPLRKDAHWNNGDPINADTWIYSFKTALDPKLANRMGGNVANNAITIVNAESYMKGEGATWEDVGIKKIDDYTIQIITEGENSQKDVCNHFYSREKSPIYQPIYEQCLSADGTTSSYGADLDHWMGCGPYLFTTWDYDNVQIYTKNPDYWLADLFHWDEVNIRIVPEMNARVELWEKGELDDLSPDAKTIDMYIDDPRMVSYGSLSVYHIDINCKNPNNPICGTDAYRKAIYHSLDRETLAKNIFGHTKPAGWYVNEQAGLLSANGLCYRDSDPGNEVEDMVNSWGPYGYNPDMAWDYFVKACEEVNIDPETADITILYAIDESDTEWKACAEYLEQEWKTIFKGHMNLEIVAYAGMSATDFKKTGDDKWDLSPNDWSRGASRTYPYTCFYYYLSSYSGKPNNYTNQEFEDQYAYCESIKNGDYNTLLEETAKLEKIYLEHVIHTPVVQAVNYQLFSDDLILPVSTWVPGFGWGTIYGDKNV